jgi:hypothetical protein
MRTYLIWLMLCSTVILNAESSEKIVVLPAGQVIEGNYFAIGKTVEISGIVEGDVYVLGGQVIIDGKVTGDVLGAGGSLLITGEVGGSIRVLGGQIMLSGPVGRNVTLVAGNAQVMASSNIEGGLVAIVGNAEICSSIKQDVMAVASNLRFSSHVQRNVEAYVGHLRLTSKAIVEKNLEYTSSTAALIDPQSHVNGETKHHTMAMPKFMQGQWAQGILVGSKIAATLMNFIYSLVVGCVLIHIFPQTIQPALHALRKRPFKALVSGVMTLVILPIAFLLLLMTVLGAPFALTLLAVNIVSLYTAKIVAILSVANPLFEKIGLKPNRFAVLFLGLTIYFGLTAIPVIGSLITAAALLMGLGASVLGARNKAVAHEVQSK